jgi:hypothetical protein
MPDIFDQLTQGQSTPPSGTAQPTTTPVSQGQGDIFDQLANGTYKEPTEPVLTPAQIKYRQDTAAGPFTKPGAAEAATDVTSPEAIHNMEIGAGATLGGAAAAPYVAGSIGPALEYAKSAEEAIKAMAKAHPFAAKVIGGILGAEGYKHKDWLLKLLP